MCGKIFHLIDPEIREMVVKVLYGNNATVSFKNKISFSNASKPSTRIDRAWISRSRTNPLPASATFLGLKADLDCVHTMPADFENDEKSDGSKI